MKKLLMIVFLTLIINCNTLASAADNLKNQYTFEYDTMILCESKDKEKLSIIVINEEKKSAWASNTFYPKIKIKEKKGSKLYTGKTTDNKFRIDMSKNYGKQQWDVGGSQGWYTHLKGPCKLDTGWGKNYYKEEKEKLVKETKKTTKVEKKEEKKSSNKSLTEELKELKELYEDGSLTKEQFEKAKDKLLN
jgi:hypothetical protein